MGGRTRPIRGRPIGDVLAGLTRDEITADLARQVDENGPVPAHNPELGQCHLWTGRTEQGYGAYRFGLRAHRVALWLATGEEPEGRHALHHCDNPPCMRREHLYWGTHRDNMDDMAERRRAGRVLKVADGDIATLRERFAAGERIEALAEESGISRTQMRRIVHGHTRRLDPLPAEWRDKGFINARQRLSREDHEEIKRRAALGEANASLARAFGISTGYVSELVNGRVRQRTKGPKPARPREVRTLSIEEVREIRRRWEQGGISQRCLADEFRVNQTVVCRIVNRMSYREVA